MELICFVSCCLQVGLIIMMIFIVVIVTLTNIGIGRVMLTVLSLPLLAIAALMPLVGYSFGYVLSAIFRLSQS